MENFNFFKILERGDKELVHSAMIAYLIDSNIRFRTEFLKMSNIEYKNSELEKSCNYKKQINSPKSTRFRCDVFIESVDESEIVVIENKFKSAPELKQLIGYNEGIKKKFLNKPCRKILFCFDKNLAQSVLGDIGWLVYDYEDLFKELSSENYSNNYNDEGLFIKHYCELLNDYITKKGEYELNANELFRSRLENETRFWRRLFNAKLYLLLKDDALFKNCEYSLNPGNTADPLLNIYPHSWKKIVGYELLLQFQGDDLKLYAHYDKKIEDIDKWKIFIDKLKLNYLNKFNDFEVKNLVNVIPGSMYVCKIKVKSNMENNIVTIEKAKNLIVQFYQDCNSYLKNI